MFTAMVLAALLSSGDIQSFNVYQTWEGGESLYATCLPHTFTESDSPREYLALSKIACRNDPHKLAKDAIKVEVLTKDREVVVCHGIIDDGDSYIVPLENCVTEPWWKIW